VVSNLVGNALKFTPSGGRVDVALQRANGNAELTVSDNGIGLEAAALPTIFDRFRQVDSSSARRHGGLGLGLSICKSLVELHGGSIAALSDGPGKGTTIRVSLPLSSAHPVETGASQEMQAPSSPDPSPPAPLPSLRDYRILIVEDDPDARSMLQSAFEKAGAQVHTAASAGTALDLTATLDLDLLVSDIGMPGKDGLQMISELRSQRANRNSGVPAIALTAFAAPEDRSRALLAGFDAFVPKPVELPVVLAMASRMARPVV
jgi:CheY-like chemotaxis protein